MSSKPITSLRLLDSAGAAAGSLVLLTGLKNCFRADVLVKLGKKAPTITVGALRSV